MPLDTSMGEAGHESGKEVESLSNDLECSVSEASEESGELQYPSRGTGARTAKLLEVRRTGLPFLPRPSLEGLPGAPVGILSPYFLGTMN